MDDDDDVGGEAICMNTMLKRELQRLRVGNFNIKTLRNKIFFYFDKKNHKI